SAIWGRTNRIARLRAWHKTRITLRSIRATRFQWAPVVRMERSAIRESLAMVRYRRNLHPGGTFFFTVTLDDRRSSALTDHADKLRAAFRVTRTERPFTVDAIVVLP